MLLIKGEYILPALVGDYIPANSWVPDNAKLIEDIEYVRIDG